MSITELRSWLHNNYRRIRRDELLISAHQQSLHTISLLFLLAATFSFALSSALLYLQTDELVSFAITGLALSSILFIISSMGYFLRSFDDIFDTDEGACFISKRILIQLYEKYERY